MEFSLQCGDVLCEVDYASIRKMGTAEVSRLIFGRLGTEVALTISRIEKTDDRQQGMLHTVTKRVVRDVPLKGPVVDASILREVQSKVHALRSGLSSTENTVARTEESSNIAGPFRIAGKYRPGDEIFCLAARACSGGEVRYFDKGSYDCTWMRLILCVLRCWCARCGPP